MDLLKITNITDHPDNPDDGSLAHILEIYGVEVMPGNSIQIDSSMINEKILDLQLHRFIYIGGWPEYYKKFRNPPYVPQPASEPTNSPETENNVVPEVGTEEELPETKVEGLFSFSAKKKKDK